MKVINRTKNTLYIEDIDLYIPFNQEQPEFVSPEKLKKSRGLRNSILNGSLEVVEYDKTERIENSLIYLLNKVASKKSEEVKEEDNGVEPPIIPNLTSTDNQIDIKIHGIFYDPSGYGKVNRNIALKLKESGYNVKISPKRSQNQLKEEELKDIVAMEKTIISRNHILIDSIIPSFSEISSGKYKVLYTTIESYTVPQQFLECCKLYDEIWLTCLEPSTVIETPCGPKKIDNIKVNDYVISGKGVPKKVIDKRVMNHNGPIVEIKTKNGYQAKMTLSHRLYVRKTIPFCENLSTMPGYTVFTQREGLIRNSRKVVKYLACPPSYYCANEISANDWVFSPNRNNWTKNCSIWLSEFVSSKWQVDSKGILCSKSRFARKNTKSRWNIRPTKIKNKLNINDDIAYFLGLYAAEGSNDGNSFSLAMSETEMYILKNVQDIIKHNFNLSAKIRKPSKLAKSLELRASSRILCEFLDSACGSGAAHKKIPNFIFTMKPNIKKSFLKGVLEGDGWVGKNSISFRVVSKELRDGCVTLMYDFGLLPSISENHKLYFNKKWNIQSRFPTYSLRVGGKQFVESQLLGIKNSCKTGSKSFNNYISVDEGYWHKVRSVKKQSYCGKVIDITVEDDETFCIQSICSHNSEWSASILRKYIKDVPIYTVATGVDPELYSPIGPRFDFSPKLKEFVFLSVFAWNYRKGYDVLLKAYFDEFSANENVSLLIMSRYQSGQTRHHRQKIKDDIDKIMQEFPNKDMPHVVRYGQMLPESDMPKIYRASNAFVLPSRGEGGNLCAPEAALCGLPVIMTNCSGQQGYLRKDNSYMIEIDRLMRVERGQFNIHYWDGQKFPQLTSKEVHDQLKRAMRSVFEDKKEAEYKVQRMQKLILEKFTWTSTTNAAIERIEQIAPKLKG